jgi:hypothetical protein
VLHILIKTRLSPTEHNYNDKCHECSTVITLSNFPIFSDESITFICTDQRGAELKFKLIRYKKQKCLKKGAKAIPEADKEKLGEEESKTMNEKRSKKLKKLILPNDSNVAKGNT